MECFAAHNVLLNVTGRPYSLVWMFQPCILNWIRLHLKLVAYFKIYMHLNSFSPLFLQP